MTTTRAPSPPRALHWFALGLTVAVVLLISAGALVTSKEAGLSVPDWPLSYGGLNPPRWWEIENVRAEHGHRLIAGTVALLTVALAVWITRREPRRWVVKLAWVAVGAVLLQALLGGLTVLLFLPTAVSVAHAALAELFLCLVTTLAVVTSPWWRERGARPASGGAAAPARLAAAVTGLVYLQILVGAVMRHSGAGLAIPDIPLAFGRLVPPRFDFAIGIHYAHRVGAVVVTTAIVVLVARALRARRRAPGLAGPAMALAALVAVQVSLGLLVVYSAKQPHINTAHVATGATLLATSLVLTLRSARLAAAAPAGARRLAMAPSAASGEPASSGAST